MSHPRDTGGRPPAVLPEALWRRLEDAHTSAVDELTAGHLERRRRGEPHPVVDFLFTYYRTSVGTVRRWHPGPGLLLEGAQHTERREWRHYRTGTVAGRTGLLVDAASVRQRRGERLDRARGILAATLARPGATGCFGLHEWAMLHGAGREGARHRGVPLRLAPEEIDAVVEDSGVRCTHFDAFRFFTDSAVPLNHRRLDRDGQAADEQPACLHAGMDAYAWATGMEAGAPGELVVDALRAAFAAREMDMRSSPYDLGDWGLSPVPVETAAGRAEFVAFQRGWVRRTNVLRRRLLAALDALDRWAGPGQETGSATAVAPQSATATSATNRPSSA